MGDNDEISNVIDADGITEMIEPGTFIALNSLTYFEQIYVCKVHEICEAGEEIEDSNGHFFERVKHILRVLTYHF